MANFYDRYWEMRQGGPYDEGDEIFKCIDCGGETEPAQGHSGAPDPTNCLSHCSSKSEGWRPGKNGPLYKKNFDSIFPDAPGSGI